MHMFTETLTGRDDVVGIACKGKLTRDDLERMHQLLHEKLSRTPDLGLLVDLTEFDGYETIGALISDATMDVAHRNDFSRVAVVGDQRWLDLGTAFARFLTNSEMRWFDSTGVDEAAQWASGS
jgi:hypothetical protein